MNRYHLWLMPSGALYGLLADTIKELSQTYQAPRFDPHVTLLGSLPGSEPEIVTHAARVAQDLAPFEVRVNGPAFTEHYFQCLFLRVEKSRQLVDAHAKAGARFEQGTDAPYQPHLSLLYGRYSRELKERIIAGLSPQLAGRFTVTHLDLIRATSDDPQDWMRIQSIPFREDAARDIPI
jgi:2'-5' RNA ligase